MGGIISRRCGDFAGPIAAGVHRRGAEDAEKILMGFGWRMMMFGVHRGDAEDAEVMGIKRVPSIFILTPCAQYFKRIQFITLYFNCCLCALCASAVNYPS
jgi:hypothetical protein